MATISYHIYRNDGAGGPIDYSTPVATTADTSWTAPGPLACPGDWKFGVRAFRTDDAQEEQNLDVAAALVLDAQAVDVTRRPTAPSGLRAIPRPAGAIRVEWGWHGLNRTRLPRGFRVYVGIGGPPDYATPRASTPYVLGKTSYSADLTGLASGTTCWIAVRAFNDAGEESNTATVPAASSAAGPQGVDALTATATATQGD
jgi:hypothetical protein